MFRKILLLLIVFVAVVAGKPTSGETQNPSVMCKLPESRGYCRALIPRWRYDPATGKCYEFKYGGCDGNGNNFVSQKACMSFCAGKGFYR
ncbi:Kunitz BPTI domain containing protein [Asbolus verrucosus]|uniref:Kunitz BPTI domain containing protein n=1 Tax=Asbolus verrucosus TaxID=1661398 RepID=A0A482VHE4_ASBVE|nr:Kunitz BPTI domain containing protein [Asbolus verrucosus]